MRLLDADRAARIPRKLRGEPGIDLLVEFARRIIGHVQEMEPQPVPGAVIILEAHQPGCHDDQGQRKRVCPTRAHDVELLFRVRRKRATSNER